MTHTLSIFMVLAPLMGALLGYASNRNRLSQLITTGFTGAAAALACYLLIHLMASGPMIVPVLDWIHIGDFQAPWELRLDALTAVMLVVVFGVSTLVHLYSIGYMSQDPSIPRFMSYLSLFTFCMGMLVTSNNLLQMFFGWEGVGLCSYLLIGFWFDRDRANAASMKAFIVNRVGDFGFILGIFGVYVTFGSIEFSEIFGKVGGAEPSGLSMTVICLLLFVGAMGKSAQIGLHVWLADAMEGPTPVSALIHAATMVTAGVFMVARLSPLFEQAPLALEVIAVIGATTAFFASTIALTQNDIKRVIAYSTCAQLGLMFLACGLGAYNLAIFHLMTHAFFKALLFLGAGSVIHAMSDEQDMQKMGGLWRHIPITYTVMWIGSLALAGIPYFAGYFSKDAILEGALLKSGSLAGQYSYILGVASVFLTAFYSWRLLFLTFHGAPRANEHVMGHVHESPWIMVLPLLILSTGAIFTGYFGAPFFMAENFWQGSVTLDWKMMEDIHHLHEHVSWIQFRLPLILSVTGIGAAYVCYILIPSLPDRMAKLFAPLYKLFYNKWYFDEIYTYLFIRPLGIIGRFFWVFGDQKTIDGMGPDGIASLTNRLSTKVRTLQSGLIYDYAFIMVGGVILIGGACFLFPDFSLLWDKALNTLFSKGAL